MYIWARLEGTYKDTTRLSSHKIPSHLSAQGSGPLHNTVLLPQACFSDCRDLTVHTATVTLPSIPRTIAKPTEDNRSHI